MKDGIIKILFLSFASILLAPVLQAKNVEAVTAGKAQRNWTVETDKIIVTISSQGLRFKNFKLKLHKTSLEDSSPLDLLKVFPLSLPLRVINPSGDTSKLKYQLVKNSGFIEKSHNHFTLPPAKDAFLEFVTTPDSPMALRQRLYFKPFTYLISVETTIISQQEERKALALELNSEALRYSFLNPVNITLYDSIGDIYRLSPTSITPLSLKSVRWSAVSNHHFGIFIIAGSRDTAFKLSRRAGLIQELFEQPANKSFRYAIYAGPLSDRLLSESGANLTEVLNFGWLRFIARPLLILLELLYGLFGNFGVAIVSLTVLVRILTFPFSAASFKNQRLKKELADEVRKLRKKHKSRKEYRAAVNELYLQHGLSPSAGCVPLLVQVPVFMGLYRVLRVTVDLRLEPFALWIKDLSAPESLYLAGHYFPLLVFIFAVVMLYTRRELLFSASKASRHITVLSTLLACFFFITFKAPSGLILYSIVTLVCGYFQQQLLKSETKWAAVKFILFGIALIATAELLTVI
ncbi:MAG: membrane protein insertase YidC [Candidatus Dadabacteria bacterium]|nr:MAG: membrane protein insertase YidC [Candidatus Dadabacteria bacterium]